MLNCLLNVCCKCWKKAVCISFSENSNRFLWHLFASVLVYISVQEVSETPAESTAPAAGKHGAYILRCWHGLVELGSMQNPSSWLKSHDPSELPESWFWLRFQVIWLQLKHTVTERLQQFKSQHLHLGRVLERVLEKVPPKVPQRDRLLLRLKL